MLRQNITLFLLLVLGFVHHVTNKSEKVKRLEKERCAREQKLLKMAIRLVHGYDVDAFERKLNEKFQREIKRIEEEKNAQIQQIEEKFKQKDEKRQQQYNQKMKEVYADLGYDDLSDND